MSCFSPGRGWVPRGHNWRSIYCGECRIQSIIIKLSCFCTFYYHTSKGDCDPDSEHDYCSLHVRLWAGQVTAQSFFKLFWINFFLVGRFLSWQTFIGSNFWWELFLVTSFHWIKFLVGRFLVTLLKYFFSFIESDWLFVRNASSCLWPTMKSNFVHVITCC